MRVIFYDVEHGSCTHIITPNGKHYLIDVGSKSNKSIAEHIKNKYYRNLWGGNSSIDWLIITHPHVDHIYDLPKLMELGMNPKVLKRPNGAFDIVPVRNDEMNKKIAHVANEMHRGYIEPVPEDESPMNSNFNGGIHFDIIEPDSSLTTKDDLNTYSCVVVAEYQGYKFVLTGDNPKSVLQSMMDSNTGNIKDKIKDATMLLSPHHGRKGEFCSDFFKCVNPYLTVISDKGIVHGSQENSSSLYKGRGAELYGQTRYVLTTRCDGTIVFEVTPGNCSVDWNREEY